MNVRTGIHNQVVGPRVYWTRRWVARFGSGARRTTAVSTASLSPNIDVAEKEIHRGRGREDHRHRPWNDQQCGRRDGRRRRDRDREPGGKPPDPFGRRFYLQGRGPRRGTGE